LKNEESTAVNELSLSVHHFETAANWVKMEYVRLNIVVTVREKSMVAL